jgi:hypothetical protein
MTHRDQEPTDTLELVPLAGVSVAAGAVYMFKVRSHIRRAARWHPTRGARRGSRRVREYGSDGVADALGARGRTGRRMAHDVRVSRASVG